jgi:hypothetical protein
MGGPPKFPPARSYSEDRRAWLLLVFGVLAAVALFRFAEFLRRPWQPPTPPRAPLPFRLAVLAYDDVGDENTSVVVSRERVAEQLRALREAGFHFVTVNQVESAYYGNGRMPERALLVTFDLGLRGTAARVDPILEDLGISAVLFVDTGKVEAADRLTVYWDRLKPMIASGHWEIGSHGHTFYRRPPENLFDLLTVRSKSKPAADPFLRSKRFLEEHLEGCRVVAFAPRTGVHFAFARKEQSRGRFSYALGFWDDLFGGNDDLTDPHWLLRLRVDPEWTAAELLRRVEWAMTTPSLDASAGQALDRWRGRTGGVQFTEDGFVLSGTPRNDVWFLGSQWLTDWEISAQIRVDADEFWITQEHRLEPGLSWRVGGTRDMLYMQKRNRESPPQILARAPRDASTSAWHRVRLVKRGRGIWFDWDGKPLFAGAVALPGRHLGKVGFVCSQDDGQGRLEVRSPRIFTFPYRVSPISGDPDAREVAALLASSATLAAVSPPLLRQEGAAFGELPFNARRLKMLCAKHGLDFLPTVTPADARPLDDPQLSAKLLARAAASGWDGYRVDLEKLPGDSRDRWLEATDAWRRPYYRAGLRLVVDAGSGGVARP